MERFISKSGIIFTLIFSFLLSFFTAPNIQIEASSITVNQDVVNVTSIEREGNDIIFVTKKKLSVIDITYEVCFMNGGIKEGDLITTKEFNKIDDYTYSFGIASSIIGVKLHEIRYVATGEEHTPSKNTTGKIVWGDVDSTRKKNYIATRTDELQSSTTCASANFLGELIGSNEECVTIYVFYFDLDTEIDEIIDITFEYSIKVVEKRLFGKEKSYTKTKLEIKVDHEELTWRLNGFDDLLKDVGGKDELERLYNKLSKEEYREYLYENGYIRPALGPNTDNNKYDWYLSPLTNEEVALEESEDFWGHSYYKEFLQEVGLVKMSYYSHGEYFEDIPVKDEDTGWIDYKHDDKGNFLDWLVEMIDKIIDFFGGNIIVTIIFFVIVISIIIALIKLGIKKTFQGICWIVEKIVSIILSLLKFIICLPFIILKKIFGKKQE